ncbi:hypothetical protein [Pseudomonas alabamensis]|uniref:hypothetical protein n=1 Tax=Pseudomonas alabamensis TaxID=3064349 RepID=UPI0011A986DA
MDDATWKLIVDIAQTTAAFAGAASAIFAGLTIRKSSNERKNSHLLHHARTSLERSFQALCGDTQSNSAPTHDRTAWLTAARLIEEYKTAKARISDKLTLQECESHEEHWRYQFYERLKAIENGPQGYFSPRPRGEEIQKISAMVIHAFATWPEGKPDPLNNYESEDEAYERLGIHLLWFKLRQYCNRP